MSIHGDLKTALAAEKGRVKAALLVAHGAPDPVVPKADRGAFETEMNAAGAKWQMAVFSGVLHAYTDQDADDPWDCRLGRTGHAADLRAHSPIPGRCLRCTTVSCGRSVGFPAARPQEPTDLAKKPAASRRGRDESRISVMPVLHAGAVSTGASPRRGPSFGRVFKTAPQSALPVVAFAAP